MEIGTTEYTRLKSLETVAERLVEENTELKAQIEKMKCCGNCIHYTQDNNYTVGACKIKYNIEGNNICDDWELEK